MRRLNLASAVVFLLLLVGRNARGDIRYTVTDLDVDTLSVAHAINNSGQVVGHDSTVPGKPALQQMGLELIWVRSAVLTVMQPT